MQLRKTQILLVLLKLSLNDSVVDAAIAIENFTLYRIDKLESKKTREGGVLLCVRSTLLTSECHELNKCSNESIWRKTIYAEGKELLVEVVYKSLNADKIEVWSIHSMLKNISHNEVAVIGDLNYPSINWKLLFLFLN